MDFNCQGIEGKAAGLYGPAKMANRSGGRGSSDHSNTLPRHGELHTSECLGYNCAAAASRTYAGRTRELSAFSPTFLQRKSRSRTPSFLPSGTQKLSAHIFR